jgi:type IV secretion system protein TrbL
MGAAASTAYRLGQETSGEASFAAGVGGVARAGGAAISSRLRNAGGLREAAEQGQRAALSAGSASTGAPTAEAGASDGPPDWARRLRSEQAVRHHRHVALQAIRDGDRGGAGAHPDIKEREE